MLTHTANVPVQFAGRLFRSEANATTCCTSVKHSSEPITKIRHWQCYKL